jgi:inosose dehydratase
MKKKIKIGIQPTGWTNDDFPEIGDDTPYQLILDETVQAKFEGGSTGHNYPTHLPSLKAALHSRSLGITSTWVSTQFTNPVLFNPTIDFVKGQIEFLKQVGASDIVVAELFGSVNQVRDKSMFDDRPRLNEPQWFLLSRGLNQIGQLANDAGMKLSFHPHLGSAIQDADEIERMLADTDEKLVHLCLDTAHQYSAGVDPVDLTRRHIHRIGHVHLKNVRSSILDDARSRKYSFYESIIKGIFTVPGDGEAPFDCRSILHQLIGSQYQGWIVVEAEQWPSPSAQHKAPIEYATIARSFIRECVDL